MIRSHASIRFTPIEVEEFRQVGLSLGDVRHQHELERAVSRWAHTLADERFDLLQKIASEMAKTKGVKLPPKFRALSASLWNGRTIAQLFEDRLNPHNAPKFDVETAIVRRDRESRHLQSARG